MYGPVAAESWTVDLSRGEDGRWRGVYRGETEAGRLRTRHGGTVFIDPLTGYRSGHVSNE